MEKNRHIGTLVLCLRKGFFPNIIRKIPNIVLNINIIHFCGNAITCKSATHVLLSQALLLLFVDGCIGDVVDTGS